MIPKAKKNKIKQTNKQNTASDYGEEYKVSIYSNMNTFQENMLNSLQSNIRTANDKIKVKKYIWSLSEFFSQRWKQTKFVGIIHFSI